MSVGKQRAASSYACDAVANSRTVLSARTSERAGTVAENERCRPVPLGLRVFMFPFPQCFKMARSALSLPINSFKRTKNVHLYVICRAKIPARRYHNEWLGSC